MKSTKWVKLVERESDFWKNYMMISSISGQTLNELGGNIQNCEPIKIELKGKPKKGAFVTFRNLKMEIENSNRAVQN